MNQSCRNVLNGRMVFAAMFLACCICLAAGGARAWTARLPAGLRAIEEEAFRGDASLEEVVLPQGLEEIGAFAFHQSGVTEVSIPGTVRSIGLQAFDDCDRLREVWLEDGVQSIGDYAFYSCDSLTFVGVPASVKSIGRQAFDRCREHLAIYTPYNSYGMQYAVENDLKVMLDICPVFDVQQVATDTYQVTWEPVEGAASYRFAFGKAAQMEQGENPAFFELHSQSIMIGAEIGIKYYFIFEIEDVLGGAAQTFLSPEPIIPLPAPENLRWEAAGDAWVHLSWDPVPGAEGYRVYTSETQDLAEAVYMTYTAAEGLDPDAPAYDAYLSDGAVHYVWVCADNGNGPNERAAITVDRTGSSFPAFAPRTYRVMVINYDPVFEAAGGRRWHELMSHWNNPRELAAVYISDMYEASHGYLTYEIADWIDVGELPAGRDGFGYSLDEYYRLLMETNAATGGAYWTDSRWEDHGFNFDYDGCLKRFGVVERVGSDEIDEVWIFTGPCHGNGLYESCMFGRNAFWINGPGTYRNCRRFTVYGFNYERGVAEMLHDAGHRMERTMDYVFGSPDYGKPYEDYTDWEKFSAYELAAPGRAGLGMVHYPPNAVSDYDYGNSSPVLSTCDDWLNYPHLTGAQRTVTGAEWGSDHRQFMKWWFSHIPHAAGTNGMSGAYNNWWIYFSLDF